MRLTLPDTVIDAYDPYATAQGRTVEEVITAQLTRFAKHEPGRRAVVIGKSSLEALEQAIGGTPIISGEDLVTRVSRLASVNFHGVHLDFNAAQLAELAHRAGRQGRPVDALVKEILDRILQDFFWVPDGGGVVAVAPPAPPTPSKPRTPAKAAAS